MNTFRRLLNLLVVFAFPLFFACSDDEEIEQDSGRLSISETYLVPQNLDKSSTSIKIPIETTLDLSSWDFFCDERWLQCSKQKDATGGSFLKVNVSENTTGQKRTAYIKITSIASTYTITITQYAENDVIVEEDFKVTPYGGKSSEHQDNQDIDKTYDGKTGSDNQPYHSPWGKSANFPVTLEYYFNGKQEIDYLIYYTRSGNGNFGKVKIYTSTDPERKKYEQQGEYDFKEQNAPSKVSFPQGVKATAIKFEVYSGLNNFVSCDEMEFYKINTDKKLDKQLLTVFTDITCSELKPGITEEQFQELPDYFVRVAEALLNNNYEQKEFRIRDYKPYSNIAEWAEKLMTKKYSDLDNPTGISVEAGDEIIVLVGDTHGQDISLQCIWETGTEYKQTASSGDVYMLNPGVNKLTMKGQGQLFVMYNTDPDSEPIRVHIPLGSGKATGFFDLEEHKTDEKYHELLSKATHKYFCVRGERIMFYFHRDKLKEYVPDHILSAIHLWDSIIGWQQELMGIDDVRPSKFNNHMFAISPEGSYMWASDYQIGFVNTYLNNILLRDNVMAKEDNAWGPSHEIGHVHQKAINWAGCTESSNNLFSNYTIYKLGKYKSRGKGLGDVATARYVNHEPWFKFGFTGKTEQSESTEIHMRMYWQLWIYYHRCGYKTDFWQTLFKKMREVHMTEEENPGKKQLEFAKMASEAAGEDLTDFFDMWGFFTPVKEQVSQYGTYQYTVTETMIKEAKEAMSKFKKPAHAFQYIEDRKKGDFQPDDYRYKEVGDVGYFDQFTGEVKKVSEDISAEKSVRKITVRNGDNAVAFELRKKAENEELGELLYFSNFKEFEIPESISNQNPDLYAVQADGERILIETK